MSKSRQGSGGFTLLELTLTALILSILASAAIPIFKTLWERSELQQVTGEFIGTLRYAQQRAIMEREPIRVVIDPNTKTYWVPVEEEEKKHTRSYSRRHQSHRRSVSRSTRIREVKELQSALPKGFIFEFVYKVAEDKEIRKRGGELYFYPDGSADAAYITLLRLANKREDERRVFMKVSAATGTVKSMEGTTNSQGSDFYRGFYDDRNAPQS